jgi:hypothetical protein
MHLRHLRRLLDLASELAVHVWTPAVVSRAMLSAARGKRCPPSYSCRPGRRSPSARQPTPSSTHSAIRTRSAITGLGSGKTAERLGEARPLSAVADDEISEALELLWGSSAVNTWNARRASVLSWLSWCGEGGYDGPSVPAWAKRLTPPDSETPARSKMAIDRLIARREVHLQEKRCGGCCTRPAPAPTRSSASISRTWTSQGAGQGQGRPPTHPPPRRRAVRGHHVCATSRVFP